MRDRNSILITSLLKRLGCETLSLPTPPTIRPSSPGDCRRRGSTRSASPADEHGASRSCAGCTAANRVRIQNHQAPHAAGASRSFSPRNRACHVSSAYRAIRSAGSSASPGWRRACCCECNAAHRPDWASASLTADLPANGPREFYQPAVAERGTLRPLNWRGSADVLTLARANALIRRPAGAPAIAFGGQVEFLRLP